MKYIFDFDDVIFKNTSLFKVSMFSLIEKEGVSIDHAKELYNQMRIKEFSLTKFLNSLFTGKEEIIKTLYSKIMGKCPLYINQEVIDLIKKAGKENCFLVTNGEQQFQKDKIEKSGITPLFKEIYIVPDSKREVIEKICKENINEKIVFMDDKPKFFEDLDMNICKNLETVLYRINETKFDKKTPPCEPFESFHRNIEK
ncbi:MAG: HAD hydrolase-like protein [Candidatus Paceibacterota bacterium]|jgi:FMN phosphatase YigB (HAD superfamily)